MDDAVKLADIFLPEENITYLQYRDGKRDYYDATAGALSLSMVMILNENSASASEILAGAFQDYGIATVVGLEATARASCSLCCLWAATAKPCRSRRRSTLPARPQPAQVGITPDVVSELPEGDTTLYELGDLNDPQLKTAYDVALQKIAGTFVNDAPISPDEGTQGEGDAAMAEDDPLAEIPFWPVS